MFVVAFELLGVLKNIFGVLLGDPIRAHGGNFDLFDLLDRLELNQEHDGIDVVLMESLNHFQMHIQDTVLVLLS